MSVLNNGALHSQYVCVNNARIVIDNQIENISKRIKSLIDWKKDISSKSDMKNTVAILEDSAKQKTPSPYS